jgi:hypothetical protein
MATPPIIIQIRLLFAAVSRTARLNLGSNKNPAKIIAAAIVPNTPAKVPKRIATSTTTARKRKGKKTRNELAWNGTKQAAEPIHSPTPKSKPLRSTFLEFRVDFSTPRQQLHRALLVYPRHTLSARNVPQSMSFSNRQLQANTWNRLESNSQRSEKIPLTLSRRQQGSVTRFLLARFRLPPLLSLWEPYLLSTLGSYHQKFSAETALGAGSKGWANTEETSRLGSKKRPLHRTSSAECSKTVIAGELAERLMAPVLKSDPFRSARPVPNPLQR